MEENDCTLKCQSFGKKNIGEGHSFLEMWPSKVCQSSPFASYQWPQCSTIINDNNDSSNFLGAGSSLWLLHSNALVHTDTYVRKNFQNPSPIFHTCCIIWSYTSSHDHFTAEDTGLEGKWAAPDDPASRSSEWHKSRSSGLKLLLRRARYL